jgi:Ni,Fe-hydrogenase III small subunit
MEIHAIDNPICDCERFGRHFTASPRFADLLLVSGPVTFNTEIALRRTYAAMPAPKLVIAIGDCGRDRGIFRTSAASL